MAQSGFTPILLYASGTPGNSPSAGNLTSSASGAELAVNYADGKLFYKDSGGNVQTLASKATGSIGGSDTQVQYNSSGSLAGSANLTFNGTTLTANALTVSTGNLSFSGTAQRITGDMSNATIANRLAFQTSTTNGNTTLNVIPNGTGTASQFVAHMGSDPANTSRAGINVSGSAALVFSDITGTGTYLPMTFYTGGSERMRIDTSGNLALGTTNAGTAGLSISQSLNLSWEQSSTESIANLFRQTSSAALVMSVGYKRSATANGFASSFGSSLAKTAISLGTTAGAITFYTDAAATAAVGTDVTPTERMRITSSGNVGIGTASPSGSLQVNAGNTRVRFSNTAGTASTLLFGADSGQMFLGAETNAPIYFITNNTERMRIDSSGNVGIGTTSPSYMLHLQQNGNTQVWVSATNAGSNSAGIGFENQGQRNWQIWADRTNDALQFGNNSRGTTNMVINSSGNVGIGTTSPTGPLSIRSGSSSHIVLDVTGTSDDWGIAVESSTKRFYINEPGTGDRLTILQGGNVGVGTASPTFRLVSANNGTDGGWMYSSGAISVLGLGGYASAGDGAFQIRYDRSIGATTLNGGSRDTPAARVTIDNTGNVGVGTTSPSGRVDVFTSGTTTSNLIVRNGTVGAVLFVDSGAGYTGTTTNHPQLFLTNNTERMRIDSSGNVGIGTSSPNTLLHLYAATNPVLRLAGGADAGLYIDYVASFGGNITVKSNQPLVFKTNDAERARITATGNIVAGASAALATNATDGFLYVPTCAGTPTGTPTAITGMAPIVVNTTNNKLYFYSGGAWRDAGP